MVLVGLTALIACSAGLWVAGQIETEWVQGLCVVGCGIIFAGSLLCIGYGLYYGNIVHVKTFDVPVWVPK